MEGKIDKYFANRGFGFIASEGISIYFHISSFERGFLPLVGVKVTFEKESSPKGPKAVHIRIVPEVSWQLRDSVLYVRNGVAAPVVARRQVVGSSEQKLESEAVETVGQLDWRYSPVADEVKRRLQDYLSQPQLSVRGIGRASESVFWGEEAIPLEDLLDWQVHLVFPGGSRGRNRPSVKISPAGYSINQAVTLTLGDGEMGSIVLKNLIRAGKFNLKSCVACKNPLLVTDPAVEVHPGDSFCDRHHNNGAFFQHRWQMLRQSARLRLGIDAMDAQELVDFFYSNGMPELLVSVRGENVLLKGWKDPLARNDEPGLLDGRCFNCGDLLVVDSTGDPVCVLCGHRQDFRGKKLLAKSGQTPVDPYALSTLNVDYSQLNNQIDTQVTAVRYLINLINFAYDQLPQGHPLHLDIKGDYDLLYSINRVTKACSGLVRLGSLRQHLTALEEELGKRWGDFSEGRIRLENIRVSIIVADSASQQIALRSVCPLCGLDYSVESRVGFSSFACDRHQNFSERDLPVGKLLTTVVNERGEVLAAAVLNDYAPVSHIYRGPQYGATIVLSYKELRSRGFQGIWDGVTPFSETSLRLYSKS